MADAVVVSTAERLRLRSVLTVDLRHFRVVQTKLGPLRLLPAELWSTGFLTVGAALSGANRAGMAWVAD